MKDLNLENNILRNYVVQNGDRDLTKPLGKRVSLKTLYKIQFFFGRNNSFKVKNRINSY